MQEAEEMLVNVRLFAMLRERAGTGTVELRIAPGATVADALSALAADPRLAELLARLPVRLAVNRDYAAPETALAPGDELALIPPVSGGAFAEGEPLVRVGPERLSAERLQAAVADPRAGAIVTFQGVTREVEQLEYEAYAEMATEQIEAILRDCLERHGACAAAAEHRTGTVPLGEPSVIVAVSAPHREQAFAAARDAIDGIKARAPIWKRELRPGGERSWVDGNLPAAGPEAPAPPERAR
jgi:molybdopterin synthase catalytic subunit